LIGPYLISPILNLKQVFSSPLVTIEPNWGYLAATGDAEKTKDRHTDKKLGAGVLGTQMETHNSFIASVL
jgi:hypothetical protein